MGLLDFLQDPALGDNASSDDIKKYLLSSGLLSAGANMMAAAGPSRMPVSIFQVLGKGLGGFTQGQDEGAGVLGTLGRNRLYKQQGDKYAAEAEREKSWNDPNNPVFAGMSPQDQLLARAAGPSAASGLLGREDAARIRRENFDYEQKQRQQDRLAQIQAAIAGRPPPAPRAPIGVIGPDGIERWEDPSRAIGMPRARSTMTMGYDEQGRPVITNGPAKPLTEFQGKDATFADRLYDADSVLSKFDKEGTDFWAKMANNVPLVGNYFQTEDYQLFQQAKEDFINATLRKESGAVINPDEFTKADKQYFPQPGDGPQVIERKRRNRQVVLNGMIRGAGPSYVPPWQRDVAAPARDRQQAAPTAPATPAIPAAQTAQPGANKYKAMDRTNLLNVDPTKLEGQDLLDWRAAVDAALAATRR